MMTPSAARAAPFDFLDPITGRDRSWWRITAMAGALPVAALLLTIPVVFTMMALGDGRPFPVPQGPRLAQSAAYVLEIAAGLAALALGVLVAARLVFRRPIRSWITAAPRFRWRLVAWAAGFTAVGVGALMAAGAMAGDRPQLPLADPSAGLGLRLAYALACLVAFLAAAWAEEATFRGYLLQQVSAFTDRAWVAIAISSVAFALMHLEFDPAALIARTLAGAAFAWAALRLGGLEFAIGAHLATNLMIALVQAPMLPDDAPFTGGLQDVTLEVILAAYVVVGVEVARRDSRLTGATSSPA
jgi:membrane protease YdiL (CAAX protease family)